MNIERFHAIALAVKNDIKATNVDAILKKLLVSLQNLANQPQAPQFQQQVGDQLRQLETALSASAIDDFNIGWRQSLKEIGAYDFLGIVLLSRIKEIFERNTITPSVALKEISAMINIFNSYNTAFEQVIVAFELMKIGHEDLEPGQVEVRVLIPRSAINSQLDEFAKDLAELDKILNVFSELTGGNRPSFKIRSISSSDLTVYLAMTPVIGRALSKALERLLDIYKKIVDTRSQINKLKQNGVPENALKAVQDHADSQMEVGIEELAKDLLEEYYKKEEAGRRNELKIELRYTLNDIANRIDRGYNIDIVVKPLPVSETEDGKSKTTRAVNEQLKSIQAITKKMEYPALDGKPILNLPISKKEPKKS